MLCRYDNNNNNNNSHWGIVSLIFLFLWLTAYLVRTSFRPRGPNCRYRRVLCDVNLRKKCLGLNTRQSAGNLRYCSCRTILYCLYRYSTLNPYCTVNCLPETEALFSTVPSHQVSSLPTAFLLCCLLSIVQYVRSTHAISIKHPSSLRRWNPNDGIYVAIALLLLLCCIFWCCDIDA